LRRIDYTRERGQFGSVGVDKELAKLSERLSPAGVLYVAATAARLWREALEVAAGEDEKGEYLALAVDELDEWARAWDCLVAGFAAGRLGPEDARARLSDLLKNLPNLVMDAARQDMDAVGITGEGAMGEGG